VSLDRNIKLAIPCPKCKHKTQETIARLENDPALTCGGCGFIFRVEAKDLRRQLQETEKLIAETRRKITRGD